MFKDELFPRFKDTDALGHINHASLVTWFESARVPIFKLFIPDLDPKKWSLILVKIEVEYLKQVPFGAKFNIETEVERIGTSSFVLDQKIKDHDDVLCQSKCTMVHFDYKDKKSCPIPDPIRKELKKHLINL